MIKPITPEKAETESRACIPDEVIEAFNQCIVDTFDGEVSRFTQKKVVTLARRLMKLADDTRFEACWLKVESIFKAVGWDVVYDAPAYCESYDPTFTFKRSK